MRTLTLGSWTATAALTATTLIAAPATAADYAAPSAPSNVSAKIVSDGVRVTWSPATGNPAVTHYVVHAGPGSCPVSACFR